MFSKKKAVVVPGVRACVGVGDAMHTDWVVSEPFLPSTRFSRRSKLSAEEQSLYLVNRVVDPFVVKRYERR